MGKNSYNKYERWAASEKTEVKTSKDPDVKKVLAAIQAKKPISIYYLSGSDPGLNRVIEPKKVFKTEDFSGRIYVEAYCRLREDFRNFNIGFIEFDEGQSPKRSTKKMVKGLNNEKESLETFEPVSDISAYAGITEKESDSPVSSSEEDALNQTSLTNNDTKSKGDIFLKILIWVLVIALLKIIVLNS